MMRRCQTVDEVSVNLKPLKNKTESKQEEKTSVKNLNDLKRV